MCWPGQGHGNWPQGRVLLLIPLSLDSGMPDKETGYHPTSSWAT